MWIDDVLTVHAERGRDPKCPLIKWLDTAENRARPAAEVRAEMIARDDWQPLFSVEGLLTASDPEAQSQHARFIVAKQPSAVPRILAKHRDKLTLEAIIILEYA